MKSIQLFIALLLTITFVQAQETKEEPSYSYFFVKGGFATSDLTSFKKNDINTLDKDRRVGISAGLGVSLAITPWFAIRPELVYTQKGMGAYDDDYEKGFRPYYILNADYLELPLLFSFTAPTKGALRGNFYFGGYAAYSVNQSFTMQLREPITEQVILETPVKDVDFIPAEAGACLGGGFGIDIGGLMLLIDARYTHGLTEVYDGGDYIVNRTFSVMVGVGFTAQ